MPHIEELHTTARTAAPGWSYVVDTGHDPSKLAINPSSRKRLRTAAAPGSSTPSAGDLTLRQQTAIQRHLAELDRDNSRDGGVVVPVVRSQGGSSRQKTPNVKRILLSGKDFAYYVEEEQALLAQRGGGAAAGGAGAAAGPAVDILASTAFAAGSSGGGAAPATATGTTKVKGPQRASKTPIARRKSAALNAVTTAGVASSAESSPAPSTAALVAPASALPTPTPASAAAPTTASKPSMPPPPPPPSTASAPALNPPIAHLDPDSLLTPAPALTISASEIAALLAAPPLTYAAARSLPPPAFSAPPRRVFCEICGFWGRVKCMKCGARVCGLECRAAHDESRCVKFYA